MSISCNQLLDLLENDPEQIIKVMLAEARPLQIRKNQKAYDLKKRKSFIMRGTGNAKNTLPKDKEDSFVYAISAYANKLLKSYKEVTNEIPA